MSRKQIGNGLDIVAGVAWLLALSKGREAGAEQYRWGLIVVCPLLIIGGLLQRGVLAFSRSLFLRFLEDFVVSVMVKEGNTFL